MKGFIIKTNNGKMTRFSYYLDHAAVTCQAFHLTMPFIKEFLHAKISGQEIWIDNAPELNIPQENASVFTLPGEAVIAPTLPSRNKIIKCMGIFYGEGKLLDCGNIFAKCVDEDLPVLQQLGNDIWKHGTQQLEFNAWDE